MKGFSKKHFRKKDIDDISTDAVFDGDYESAIFFGKNAYMNNENRKI